MHKLRLTRGRLAALAAIAAVGIDAARTAVAASRKTTSSPTPAA